MNAIGRTEWALGELLMDPQRLFVLWAVKARLCLSLDDFHDHYGRDFPIANLVSVLSQAGFLHQIDRKLVLSESGDQVVACLGGDEFSPYAISEQHHQQHQGELNLRQGEAMSVPKILVLDDDEVYMDTVKEFLERQKTTEGKRKYQVLCTSNQDEAQRLIEQRQVALALLDFYLTEGDDRHEGGYIVAQATKREFAVPRIIISIHEKLANVRKSLSPRSLAPADDFISKHWGLEEMEKIIEQHLMKAKVFLCYAYPDLQKVKKVYNQIMHAGHLPWLNDQSLDAGQEWESIISNAISASDIFLVCWSQNSVDRRGFMRREISQALEIRQEKLESDIYLIPARLEDCNINITELRKYHRVDLFEPNGFDKLLKAIKTGMRQRYGWML